MRVKHKAASMADVDALISIGVRQSNIREIVRVFSIGPDLALRETFDNAEVRIASYIGDEIMAVWGFTKKSLLSNDAYVWLIASEAVEKHWFTFARESKRMLGLIDGEYGSLENYVDAGNDQIIRWLKWLGFAFDAEPVISPLGHQLFRFWR